MYINLEDELINTRRIIHVSKELSNLVIYYEGGKQVTLFFDDSDERDFLFKRIIKNLSLSGHFIEKFKPKYMEYLESKPKGNIT